MSLQILKGGHNLNIVFGMTLILIPLYSWLSSEGNILDYFTYTVPQGQLLFVLCKLMGLYALVFLWLHMSYALVRNSALSHLLMPWSIKRHQNMALLSLTLVLIHIVLFFSAVSLRKEEIALDLFLPSFSHGSYKTLLSFGLIAFWLILLVALAGRMIKKAKIGFLWLHRLSFICFILIYIHGLGVGSETKHGILFLFYLLIGLSLLLLLVLRIFTPLNKTTRDNH